MEKAFSQQINDALNKIQATAKDPQQNFHVASLFLLKKQTNLLFDIAHYLKELVDMKHMDM